MRILDRHAVTHAALAVEAAAQAVDEATHCLLAGQRDPLLEHLYNTRDGIGSYHNHKETMAWAGAAVFLAAMAAAATNVKKPDPWWETHAAQQLALSVSFLLVLAYTRRQFNLREWAARIDEACIRKILEIVDPSATSTPAVPKGWSPPPKGGRLRLANLVYPNRTAAPMENQVLHTELLDMLLRIEYQEEKDTRPASLEHHAYFLMVMALIVASAAVWTT